MIKHGLASLISSASQDDTIVAWRQGKGITRKQLVANVRSVASAYASCRAAALICQDSYTFIVGLYGLLHAGAKIILPPGNQPAVLDALRDKFDLLIDDAAIEATYDGEAVPSLNPLDESLLAIDFCTSGTTGLPKLVSKNLSMFDRELAVIDRMMGINQTGGKVLSTVPHQHVYGFTFKLLWSLVAGHAFTTETYALWENLLPELTADSILVSSPAHLGRLAGIEPLPLQQRPRLILSAGAALSLEASRTAQRILGSRPLEIFGSTETGAIATRAQECEEDPWLVLPDITLESDGAGRMSLVSPFIGSERIELSDVVELVEGGFYHRGRADRIAKIEGKRISLINVETALQGHPLIKDAAVVVLIDSVKLAAVVILNAEGKEEVARQGAFRLSRQIKKDLAPVLDPAGIPRLWRFVDAFPNQSMGKRRAVDLMALFGEDA